MTIFMPLRGIGDDARRSSSRSPPSRTSSCRSTRTSTSTPTRTRRRARHRAPQGLDRRVLPADGAVRVDGPLAGLPPRQRHHAHERQPAAIERGAVTPMFPLGRDGHHRDADLAYLTIRPRRPRRTAASCTRSASSATARTPGPRRRGGQPHPTVGRILPRQDRHFVMLDAPVAEPGRERSSCPTPPPDHRHLGLT